MKKLSLLVALTVLVGSALFVTSCGGKIQADTVWQNKADPTTYYCFCADGQMITAYKYGGTLTKVSTLSGSYTAKNGKIKAPITSHLEADYKISGETMTISMYGVTMHELKKVSSPTVAEMKALFVTGVADDSVWQNKAAPTTYYCFGADGNMIVASNALGSLVKVPMLSGSYTAKGGKIKCPLTGGLEADYKISGETMTISLNGVEMYELKKVASPTATEMKAL
ncbi:MULTISPECIES: hypothetical protein [unclassified Treponema]|uniref:hypothetical protein n=1 Tax=unclassified Treponema TaxID=2638727 RepID=UPI0005300CB7|nr:MULTISPECIES: hypothetical protein [unclassified Treponema]AIW90089.1 hypothetical protein JO41_10005 [Treponema sp. OMZ 838]UTC49931.1 hypothetical protein E4N65_07390 [Treponema sp. OMZ 855]